MTSLGSKYGQDARLIETTVLRRQKLASEHFLKESKDRYAKREVRCRGLLANPVTYHVRG